MRTTIRKYLILLCFLSMIPWANSQVVLEFDVELYCNKDSFFSPYDDLIEYHAVLKNNGNQSFTGDIDVMHWVKPYSDTVTTPMLLRTLTNVTLGPGDTVSIGHEEEIGVNIPKFTGGDNIIVIWPVVNDNPSVLTPDTSENTIWIDPLLTHVERPRPVGDRLIIYPNPVSEYLNFAWKEKVALLESVRIYNALGQTVYLSKEAATGVSVQTLRPGMYFLDVRYRDGVRGVERIIIH